MPYKGYISRKPQGIRVNNRSISCTLFAWSFAMQRDMVLGLRL